MKKYKLTTNLPLKIIAFVFAAFLWLIVANVANPVTKSTYTNIKVTIANDDVIAQGGEVYTVLDDQNVNVVVYAKRSVIQQIKSDDIVATADIKEMDSRTGLIQFQYQFQSIVDLISRQSLFRETYRLRQNRQVRMYLH